MTILMNGVYEYCSAKYTLFSFLRQNHCEIEVDREIPGYVKIRQIYTWKYIKNVDLNLVEFHYYLVNYPEADKNLVCT